MYDVMVGDDGPELVVAATVFGARERVLTPAETVVLLSTGSD